MADQFKDPESLEIRPMQFKINANLIKKYNNQELHMFAFIKSKLKIEPQLIYMDSIEKKNVIILMEANRIKIAEKRWREYIQVHPSFADLKLYFFKYTTDISELVKNIFPKVHILHQSIHENYIENMIQSTQLKYAVGKQKKYLELINRFLKAVTKHYYTGFTTI